MKKTLLATIALAAGTLLSNAQGTISMGTTATAYLIETNAAQYVPGVVIAQTGAATARTILTANSFFYEILTQGAVGANLAGGPPSGSPTLNPFDASWLDTGVGGKNNTLTRGGNTGVGGPTSAFWNGPTGASYSTGSDQWYLIVGWSASLGTTWSGVGGAKANYQANIIEGWFGQSALAYNVSGGGPSSLPTVALLAAGGGTGIAGAGLTSAFSLGIHSVPEPGTFALAGMGLAAMLISRRRK